MARPLTDSAKRPRIRIDVPPLVRRRLRIAAARRDVSVRQYVLDAIEEQLREDLQDGEELALTARTDPRWRSCGTTSETLSMSSYSRGDIVLVTGILRTIKQTMVGRKLGSLSRPDLDALDRELLRCLGLNAGSNRPKA